MSTNMNKDLNMGAESLNALKVRQYSIADTLDQRTRQAIDAVSASGERLAQAAQGLQHNGQRVAQDAVQAMGVQARDAVEQGMRQAFDRYAQELQQAARQATHTANALQSQREGLERAQRGLLWKASLGLLVGAVLAVGSSGFWFLKSMQAVRHAEFSEAVTRATQTGALAPCGQKLCVKAPRNAPRYDRNSDYIVVP
jgi:hypothetical protein